MANRTGQHSFGTLSTAFLEDTACFLRWELFEVSLAEGINAEDAPLSVVMTLKKTMRVILRDDQVHKGCPNVRVVISMCL